MELNYKANTGILIRFDDIAPNMNWEMMDRCKNLLDTLDIKPVVGVIPNNKDKELLSFPKREGFWQIVKNWQSSGWSIAMHGFNHLYNTETNKKDYFNYGGKSEFFGRSYEDQLFKIKEGLKIFEQNNIRIEIFFAPNHTYDNNTFKALKNAGIHKIIDGYGIMPFIFDEIKFVPQLFYKLYFLPYGIQSTQIHINNWTEQDFKTFEDFVKKNKKKIISSNFAFSRTSDKFYIKIINNLFKSLLKLKRLLY